MTVTGHGRGWRLVLLACSLAILGTLAVPGAGPLPAGVARAASPDLTITGDAVYTVLPEAGRVHVDVDLTARYRKAETKTQKFYVSLANLAVLPGTKNFKVTGWKGSTVGVTKRTATFTMVRITFGSHLFGGQTHALRLSFDLPDPGRNARGEVRIGPSLVTFPVWAFASDGARGGSASVRFPAGYDVAVESGTFAHRSTAADGGTILDSGQLADPLSYFAYVSGQKPAEFVDSPLTVDAGGQRISLTMRALADDPGWPKRVGPLFTGGLPILRRETGLDWPSTAPSVVQEAVGRTAGGYAGLFDSSQGRIEVAYWAEPLVVLHEAAHGWFNGSLLADRWAAEGFASLYAARAATELKIKGAGPTLTDAVKTAAIPLNAWGSDATTADRATEAYGYAASLALAKAVAERAGDPALQRVWADAASRTGAYQPVVMTAASGTPGTPGASGTPGTSGSAGTPGASGSAGATAAAETVDGPPDWRGLLDLLEAETGRDFTDLWRAWVIREDQGPLLDARAAALTSYTRTLALADTWALPRAIRDALRAWRFDTAETLMADARTVLAQRAGLQQLASRDSLALPGRMRQLFEAGSMVDASAEAEAERNAMLAIRQAVDARTADADILTVIGMIGEMPEVDLQAARDAFAAGELDRTLAAADDAYRAWNGAWQEGRRRALLALAVLATLVVIGSALVGRARRSRLRPPLAAAVLAMSLVTGAALVPPAMGTGAPSLGGLAPPVVAAATDDIGITTATRYVVDPAAAVVRVAVDITAVNNKPPLVAGGITKRFFYDGVNLGVQREATGLRATQDGVPIRLTTVPGQGYLMVTVLFRENLFFQQTASLRLTFSLPSGKPRSSSDVRVGPAFATFLAWAFGDRGTVQVEVPAGFDVTASGSEVTQATDSAGLQVLTASTESAPAWYLWVNARNDDGLTRQQVNLPGGEKILVRGWPVDRAWRTRVTSLLTDAVPSLVGRIGLPWPVAGALSVIEIHTPLLEGYGGFYDVQTDRITISENLDDVTIVHEASHAWFNNRLFRDRWINEGLAEEYATRVLAGLGRTPQKPATVSRTAKVAFALNDWPPPAPIHDQVADSREQYGYDASWLVVGAVVKAAGEDGMRRVFAAADRGTTAYVGHAAPERTSLPNDWRRFLDLVEELGGADGAAALVSTWVVGPGDRAALAARADARATYRTLVVADRGWSAPVVVRMDLDAWSFPAATDAMARASSILAERDGVAATAATAGLQAPAGLETAYEDAATTGDLDAALSLADEIASSLHEVMVADQAAAAPRDWLVSLGLDGDDPDALLLAARTAWGAGDLATASADAESTVAMLAAAPGIGRTRVLVVGGGASGLVLLLGAVFLVRRRDRAGAVAVTAAPDPVAHDPIGGPAGGQDPYATLRPSGPPGAGPDAPPLSQDEGADRS